MSEWFSVKVGLRQGCVMSPWFFNLFMDGVMKEFKAKILQGGVKNGMVENTGRVSGLLFAHDTTLMAKSESNLQSVCLKLFHNPIHKQIKQPW